MPRFLIGSLAAALILALPGVRMAHAQAQAKAESLGTLQSLHFENTSEKKPLVLSGRDSGLQLVVSGKYAKGDVRDLTHQVQFDATPKGIVEIDKTGYVSALQEGKVSLRATSAGVSAELALTVTNIVNDVPLNFANDIVPIFTRFGCNAGGCHGKSGGQNGFSLSLLGFEPEEDFEFLVKESRGRRIVLSAPESSLLLMKASGRMPHGGGSKLKSDSPHYRIVHRWIEQATPFGAKNDPTVDRIEVQPADRVLPRGGTQQLRVLAHYSNGATRDVTRLAQFESNDADTGSVSETGLVQANERTGTAAIMARFLTHVDVFRATIPLNAEIAKLPPAKNFIDDAVFKQWKKLGLPPSPICDDATYLRRATIDLAGRLPTLEETKEFLADKLAQVSGH